MAPLTKQTLQPTRRLACAAALLPGSAALAECAKLAAAWAAPRDGAIVLLRHASAPGVGAPPQSRLGDCGTQRKLDESRHAQSRRVGERLKQKAVPVGAV